MVMWCKFKKKEGEGDISYFLLVFLEVKNMLLYVPWPLAWVLDMLIFW